MKANIVSSAGITVTAMCAIALVYGWVMNLATVIDQMDTLSTGEVVLRALGIVVPLIGGILGYF
jgi:hypothetical protein